MIEEIIKTLRPLGTIQPYIPGDCFDKSLEKLSLQDEIKKIETALNRQSLPIIETVEPYGCTCCFKNRP